MQIIRTTILTILLSVALFAFQSKYLPGVNIDVKCDKILHKRVFDICYSYKWKTPKVVVYSIDGNLIKQKHLSRKRLSFRPDYEVPSKYRSYSRDYSRTGFDRGHNIPNGVANYNRTIQKQTFLMSNIAPQKPMLNRKLWAKIERFARFQAIKFKKVSVVTGVCGSKGHIRNGVNIPAYWYKIIYRPDGKVISFMAPNTNVGMKRAKARDYLVGVDEIEKRCNF